MNMNHWAGNIAALLAGSLFGIGLSISGMTDPAKVQGFLDIIGTWNPSLAFVMGGAVAVTLPAFTLILKRSRPLFGPTFDLPVRRTVDKRLVFGAALFGVGWGIAGLCPGPALAILLYSPSVALPFLAAMLAGMLIYDRWGAR